MEDSENGPNRLDRGRSEPEMEDSTSSPSSLDKGKREPEMEKSESGGSSSLDKGKRETEMEDSQSGPSSPYKGKRKQEIEDESDLIEQDKAVAAIMAKTKDQMAEEDQRIKDQLLADKINIKLTQQPGASVERPCIYIVHEKFSRTSKYAYTPETVSIGPVHSDKKNLQVMEDFKERYMNTLLLRTGNRKQLTTTNCPKRLQLFTFHLPIIGEELILLRMANQPLS